jgi:hypothetical protein
LLWISEILLFSQDLVRFSEFFEFSSFSTFFRLHFSSFLPSLEELDFFDPKSCCEIDPSQKESESIRIDHIYIFLSR